MNVLFVCHANLCRSPMAERVARGALPMEIAVTSAGTDAWSGLAMHPRSALALREEGLDDGEFRSRRLTAGLVGRADLVLTATRAQRAICVDLDPRAMGRAFTIRQFGRLADAVRTREPAVCGLEAVLAAVPGVRGELQPVPPAEDDLADPVAGTMDDMRACLGEIQRSLRPVLALIAAS